MRFRLNVPQKPVIGAAGTAGLSSAVWMAMN
jgi:hypothetical protein